MLKTIIRPLVLFAALALWPGGEIATASSRPAALEKLESYDFGQFWTVANSQAGRIEADGEPVLRWSLEPGQSAALAIRPEHPLFGRLRYYDRLEFDFRIVKGRLDSLDLRAKGHVSGPRSYKIHQWALAILTTPPGVWHSRQLDLSRPNWFPWDDQDGGQPFFSFGAIAVEPGTIVELRRLRLSAASLVVKPFFEPPVTWPVRSDDAGGSVVYRLKIPVLNTSGLPTEIRAKLESRHERFAMTVDPPSQPAKNGETVTFTAEARLSKKEIAATPELYAETLRIAFSAESAPEAVSTFEMPMTRPLSPGIKKQFVISGADRKFLREKWREGGPALKELKADALIAEADKFLNIRLDQIPAGYAGAFNRWPTVPGSKPPRRYEIGAVMPEVINPVTGGHEIGTPAANATWKEYLGYSGQITEKLGWAYAFTGDEKYAAKAVELMERYASQYGSLKWNCQFEPPWSNGPAPLSASRIAPQSTYGSNRLFRWHMRMLGLIGDAPSLTPGARRNIDEGFVLPYATELAKFPGGISNMTDITNHNLLVMGLVFDDANLVNWALNTDAGLASRVRDIDDDGFSSEGRPLNYHLAAMEEYLPSLAYLKNSGLRVGDFKKRLLAAIRMPYERATLWGVVPNTGDCGGGMRVGSIPLADQLIALFPEETWLLDIGRDTTLEARLRRLQTGRPVAKEGYRQFLETKPRLFREAGLAILRTGETPETQIMATLDYGRNPMHGHLDRNQITLSAFGKVFTHGPGSLYNAGRSGTRNDDPRLGSFCGAGSLGQNVVLVDGRNQLPAIGRLLAWSDDPANPCVTARVDAIAPGVSHTRTLALRHGLVIVIDGIESAEEHRYDFVYHNFGVLSPGAGWSESPVGKALGETANYGNIVDPRRLAGTGPVHLKWDLSAETPPPPMAKPGGKAVSVKPPEPSAETGLALWQLPLPDSELYTGTTGMNNPNTRKIPDVAPSLIARARGKTVRFVTVLEPYRGNPRVTGIEGDAQQLTIHLGQETVVLRWEELGNLVK